jgi:acyl-CoA reductase-like NAD-dependent aldehyde dehydrogenase
VAYLVKTYDDWCRAAGDLAPANRLFLDGDYVDSLDGATFAAQSARDGSVLAKVASGSAGDVDRAVTSARHCFDDGRWRNLPPRARGRVLIRLGELMREHADELALLETLDVGKPIGESLRVDVPAAAGVFSWYGEAIDKYYDAIAPVGRDALALITREPLGVVAAVVPWNYPLILTAWKLAPALATGNSVVLKPAEQSPLSALLLARLAAEAGLPDGALSVVTGFGESAGQALGRHRGVDKVAFTGSEEVGKLFQRYAGESNGKTVAVEAGGKSPQLVLPDVPDLDAAASAIAWGVFYNAGQTCHAGTRLVVHSSIREELLAKVVDVAGTLVLGDPLDPATTMGPLIDTRQLGRVLGYLDLARRDGARFVTGGDQVLRESGGAYVAPTVLDAVPQDSPVTQDEIFGPVLTTASFTDVDVGIRLANDTRYGLAAAVWTGSVSTAHRIARRLRAGTVWVNTYDASSVATPFGGFGASGHGRDRSLTALDAYTALKTTWIDLS